MLHGNNKDLAKFLQKEVDKINELLNGDKQTKKELLSALGAHRAGLLLVIDSLNDETITDKVKND